MQPRIVAVQQGFIDKGFNPVTALKQTYAVIKSVMTRNALVMAFNDAFLVVAIGLLVAAVAIWFCKAPQDSESHRAAAQSFPRPAMESSGPPIGWELGSVCEIFPALLTTLAELLFELRLMSRISEPEKHCKFTD